MKTPDQNHPITITPAQHRVRIVHHGEVVADSRRALALKEASYPVVYYVPREDATMRLLARTDHSTHCPYKGDAAYYTINAGDPAAANAVWSYEAAYPAVSAISGHLAFYPQKVDAIELLPLNE